MVETRLVIAVVIVVVIESLWPRDSLLIEVVEGSAGGVARFVVCGIGTWTVILVKGGMMGIGLVGISGWVGAREEVDDDTGE